MDQVRSVIPNETFDGELLKHMVGRCIWISPTLINFAIAESEFVDYNQSDGDLLHPHAARPRGVFREISDGSIRVAGSPWDSVFGPRFNSLLEFIAVEDVLKRSLPWADSGYAERVKRYLLVRGNLRGTNCFYEYSENREREIRFLAEKLKKDWRPLMGPAYKGGFIDNVSVAISGSGEILFNNRGHHRLAIAKIIGIDPIPVKVSAVKNVQALSGVLRNNVHRVSKKCL